MREVIPDEAVEAARTAFMLPGGTMQEHMRRVLEAAAPHLMAAAWDEGFEAGEDRGDWEAAPIRDEPTHTNPYHPR